MSFETVERLKREYTDKWVTVDTGTPELKRFVGLSGRIKTVNMNGRALVQFDNPVDISWYDIDLSYLKVIDAPLPKKAAEKHAEPAAKPAAAKPAAAAAGKSPLELARAQGAAGSGGAKKSPLELAREQGAAKAAGAAPAAGEKPLSKLEQARLQGAAKAKAAAEAAAPAPVAAAPAEPAPAPAAPPAAAPAAQQSLVGDDGKPLSKIELARRQGAFKAK